MLYVHGRNHNSGQRRLIESSIQRTRSSNRTNQHEDIRTALLKELSASTTRDSRVIRLPGLGLLLYDAYRCDAETAVACGMEIRKD